MASGSIIAKKVISNNRFCSDFKNGDDIEILKDLYDKTHFKGVLVPGHSFRKTAKVIKFLNDG